MREPQELAVGRLRNASVIVALITSAAALMLIIGMYWYTKSLLNKRLDARMVSMVSTASLLFSGEDIGAFLAHPVESRLKLPFHRSLVLQLRSIKRANPDITFAYLLEPTQEADSMLFIADADVLALKPELNFNKDEVTDEGFPGSEYDVSEIEAIQSGKAFGEATTSPEIYEDYWGLLYSAYAPIKKKNGDVVAMLAIDIDISDYNRLIKATFLPFGLISIVMIALISGLAFGLLKLWGSRMELMQELDRQKDELLGIVSHQLATPISALKWDFEMLLDGDFGKFNKEQEEFFGKLQGVAKHLADLASMILDVSRIQLGRVKVDRTDLDLKEFFGEIMTIMEAKAQERKVHLTSTISDKVGIASLDKRLMRMIVENLMSNAIKYTPEGGKVKLDVSSTHQELKIVVSDTGCGIPKQDQDKIFGKLFRASNACNVDGNGFGLYVVKGAVEAQGGTSRFESAEGKGSTFIVTLPI